MINHKDTLALNTFLVLLFLFGCGMAKAPKIEKTINEQKGWFEKYFTEHVNTIDRANGKTIKLKTDGRIQSNEGLSEFEVKVGEEFKNPPDKHSRIRYTLKEIHEDGVIVEYESCFGHRSFGKNLMTIDTGEIFVKYTK